jgi:vancomycin aglycone glucosyltransferase
MSVMLSTHGSRGNAEPMADLPPWLRILGAAGRLWAPPDYAELSARVGVPRLSTGVSR